MITGHGNPPRSNQPNEKTYINLPELVGMQNAYVEGDWAARQKITDEHRRMFLSLVYFAQNDELIFNNDQARSYGAAVVQNIDSLGMEVFVGAHYQTLDRAFASYHPIIAVMSGARVRF